MTDRQPKRPRKRPPGEQPPLPLGYKPRRHRTRHDDEEAAIQASLREGYLAPEDPGE